MIGLTPREQRALRVIDRKLSRDPVLAAVTELFPQSHRYRYRPVRSRPTTLAVWCGLLVMIAGTACAVTATVFNIAALAAAGVAVVTLVATGFIVLADRSRGCPLIGRRQLTPRQPA